MIKKHAKLILQTILFHISNIYKYNNCCINLKHFVLVFISDYEVMHADLDKQSEKLCKNINICYHIKSC